MSNYDDNNPVCECDHLWSNHYQKVGMYFCEAPDCPCESFSEHSLWDEFADQMLLITENEDIDKEIDKWLGLDYDCERDENGLTK